MLLNKILNSLGWAVSGVVLVGRNEMLEVL
jgi:hypothetical protein